MSVITPVYVGKSHDFGMFKEEKMFDLLPAKIPIYTDTGFEGIDKLRDDLNIRKPKKKRKKRILTEVKSLEIALSQEKELKLNMQ